MTALATLKKTMVVCHNQSQARQALAYFNECKVSAALSTSDSDGDSLEIHRFTENKAVKVLVVVNRATLGFNYPDLVNVVDISLTHNPDRLFQSLCRVVRRNDAGDEKVFVKVTTASLFELTHVVMSFVVALSLAEYFKSYDGEWKNTAVPMVRTASVGGAMAGVATAVASGLALRQIELPRLLSFSELQRVNGSADERYVYTTFKAVREKLTGTVTPRHWTKESLLLDARRFRTRKDWINDGAGYQTARSTYGMEFVEKCCEHMETLRKRWSDEALRADAQRFSSRGAWQTESGSACALARKRGPEFFAQCCAHMEALRKPRTDDALKIDALRFGNRTEWARLSPAAYLAATRRGRDFLERCCSHMKVAFFNRRDRRGATSPEELVGDGLTAHSMAVSE